MLGIIQPVLMFCCLVGSDDPLPIEQQQHQGTWQIVSFSREGSETPGEVLEEIERVVKGDRVVWYRDGKTFAATTTELDPTTDPPAIEVIPEGGPNRGKRILGIYKLDGDVLTICMTEPGAATRPPPLDSRRLPERRDERPLAGRPVLGRPVHLDRGPSL